MVRRIADDALAGKSFGAITRALNAEGVATRQGKPWQKTTVTNMLRSDSVLGRVKSRGRLVRDEHGLAVTRWEPLLSVEEVERLRALRKLPALGIGRHGDPEFHGAPSFLLSLSPEADCIHN